MNVDFTGGKTQFQGFISPGHRKPWIESYDACVPASIAYPPVTCHSLLEIAAKRFPDRVCTIFQSHTLTFSEVDLISTRLASGLRNLGLQKGDRVALLLPNIPQYVFSFFAVLKAGGIVVAMNPQATGPEIALQAAETGPVMVISIASRYAELKQIQPQTQISLIITTSLDESILPAQAYLWDQRNDEAFDGDDRLPEPDLYLRQVIIPTLANLPAVTADDPAIFQYSGGTTGTPKAAIGLHRNLTANTIQFRHWLWNMVEGQEILLAAIPMFHVYGMVLCLNLAMTLGASLLLVATTRDLDILLSEIKTHRPTLFPGVPGIYARLVDHPGLVAGDHSLESLKVCISGSAPLPAEVKRRFERLIKGRLVEGYGLSEAPTATHCNPVSGINISGSIGLPLPDVDCVILNLEDSVTEVEPGEAGELVLKGPQVMQAYYQNPEETRATLRNGWLFTGDIARMDAKGYFYILDRKKDLIKVNGLQVWPHEIEEILMLHPAIVDAGVIGIPDSIRGETVKAWLVIRPGSDITLEEVIEWCSRSLSRYKVPSQIEVISELPRSPIGKLLRRELKRIHG